MPGATGTPATPDATPPGEPVELTGPWSDDWPRGICTCHHDPDGRLVIEHADPRIVISSEVIENAASGRHDCVQLTHADYTRPGGHVGALLKIRGVNRQVIYRLTEWLPSIRAYIGEWPE